MIEVNAQIYAEAQQLVESGYWRVVPSRGHVFRGGTRVGGLNSSGYFHARYYPAADKRRQRSVLLHRVIWESVNGPIPVGLYVNHIDGDKTNNAIHNLELVTHSANMTHARRTGLWVPPVALTGDAHPDVKRSGERVREIFTRAWSGEGSSAIAAEYGIPPCAVSAIKYRRKRRFDTEDLCHLMTSERARHSESAVRRVRSLRKQGLSYRRIAIETGVSETHVRRVISGENRSSTV